MVATLACLNVCRTKSSSPALMRNSRQRQSDLFDKYYSEEDDLPILGHKRTEFIHTDVRFLSGAFITA